MKQASVKQPNQQRRKPVASQRYKPRSHDAAFVDKRDSAIAQRRLGDALQQSPRVDKQRCVASGMHDSSYAAMQRKRQTDAFARAVQKQEDSGEEKLLQGKPETAQAKSKAKKAKEPVQGKSSAAKRRKHLPTETSKADKHTGMTLNLKADATDEMKKLHKAGGNISPEAAGKNIKEIEKAKEKESKTEAAEKTVDIGFSAGEKASSATRSALDFFVPKDKEGKSFSESEKGKQPMGVVEGATDIWSALGLGVSGIFGFVKTAQLIMKNQGSKALVSFLDTVSKFAESVIKGAQGVYGVVGSAIKGGAGDALEVAKKVLGPIPDAIKTVFGVVKLVWTAARKKTKESLEAAWETVKSAINTVTGTVSTVFSLISALGKAVPIVGSIANGITAILNSIEAGFTFVKMIGKSIKMKKLQAGIAEKIKALSSGPAETEAKKAEKPGKRERLAYIARNNRKKMRNIGRQVAKQATTLFGYGTKLVGAVTSLVGDILSLPVVTAPVGAVIKAFGAVADVFGSVINGIAATITAAPKLAHSVRQGGRDLAAKGGKTGKFFGWLGFSAEKSSEKKVEARKKVVLGIFADAAKLQTDFDDPAGKDREKADAEIAKYKDLEFEIEATGADKNALYKLNDEENDEKRAKAQVKVIYDALAER